MYNEFDDRENNIYGITPEPDMCEAENITQEELHAEEFNAAEFNVAERMGESTENVFGAEIVEENTGDIAESRLESEQKPVEEPSSSFYHYTYDNNEEHSQSHNTDNSRYTAPNPYSEPKHYTKPPVQAKKQKNKTLEKFMICAGLAIVFGVIGGTFFQLTNYIGNKMGPKETEAKIESAGIVNDTVEEPETDHENIIPVSASGSSISAVAETVIPSIVAITTVSVQEVQSMFYGSTTEEYEGSGSGIIVDQNDKELLIATNNHVVEGCETLSVCFTVNLKNPEDAVVEAQVKGTDAEHDLAVIAVKLSDIPSEVKNEIKVAEMGDSDKLVVGEQAVAIGNALGYGQSVTVGYVSALDREVTVENITNKLIQTDAAINPGNSGGALLNIKGQVIGINSVKAAATGVEGMGYAIPINTAKPILDDLMNRTTREKVDVADKGYLGISAADVSDEARQIYDMPAGAFVKGVEKDSAAEKAGVVKGDIITKLDGVSITSMAELLNRMQYYKVGETIEVVIQQSKDGEYSEKTLSVTLGKQPAGASTNTQESEAQLPQDGQNQNPYGGEYGQNPYGQYEQTPYGEYGQDPFDQFFGE